MGTDSSTESAAASRSSDPAEERERRPAPRSLLNTVAAQELKRRGAGAVLDKLARGPVHVFRHNRPVFVALAEEEYRALVEELEEARIRASLADAEAGRVRHGTARELTEEIFD